MSIPFLPRGVRLHHDNVRGQEVLLGPERALMLDQIACEILKRVDGVKTEAEISAGLAADFGAPAEQVATDVRAFMADLMDKRLLEMRDGV